MMQVKVPVKEQNRTGAFSTRFFRKDTRKRVVFPTSLSTREAIETNKKAIEKLKNK